MPDFGVWIPNRPIEFAFDQRVDFATVSGESVRIRTSAGVPAAGTFAARTIDADGNGVPERTDESVVVFYPSCPFADDQSDAGLTPGERYVVALAGEDSDHDPASLLRSTSGNALAHTIVLAFEVESALLDEKPGAPMPLLRAPGARSGPGCHLEIGGDPSNQVFFEGGPLFARPPGSFSAPLDLFGDPASRVAFVVVFDQPIRPSPENLARLRLEYEERLDSSGWRPFETRTELVSNCLPDNPVVRLVPLGTFPPGGSVRVRIEAGFQDLLGETTPAPLADFALTEVAPVAFTSLDPPRAIADELREEFDFGAESPLSLADPALPLETAPAKWGQGELRSTIGLAELPPALADFDWVVREGETFLFDTTSTAIAGGPRGARNKVQETSGGLVQVRDMTIESGSQLLVRGPNPMVVSASGTVRIGGTILASGLDAQDPLEGGPGTGGPGSAGGGSGGSSIVGADARGRDGSGTLAAGPGGQGGESGFVQAIRDVRGGGGGGGRFARDQGIWFAEKGGSSNSKGAESGLRPAKGGAAGPLVFADGDPSNDFFGVQPVLDANGNLVGRRRGELGRIHAGTGGGSGGDSIAANAFPPPDTALVREGAGGGGGGGALVIRAAGPIVFEGGGFIVADGGRGGRRGTGSVDPGGSCGGSGSGGHVILDSATAIDFTGGNPSIPRRFRISCRGGSRIQQGNSLEGYGGQGGPGVVQLHVPHPERPPGDPSSELVLSSDALGHPDPLLFVSLPRPNVLFPLFEARSSARSRWIPLGAAGGGSASSEASVVAFLFDGIETAPGEDEGKVRASGGRVAEPAPLLGPTSLSQPGVELLPDGISLALSGAVLAPLRASARPISPDVYLRTPALLEGFTLRLESPADPGRRVDLAIAQARYDDAAARLTLSVGGLLGTLAEAAEELGGGVDLALVTRFFRVRQGSVADLLPDSGFVRILFQGAGDDGTGRPDELAPLVDWTADVTRFDRLAPGALDFVRFRVEFDLDADGDGLDPGEESLALDFLRLPMRF